MINRHAKPTLKTPARCPKCGGYITSDVSYEHGRPVNAYRCANCGQTSESDGWYDARKKDTVPLGRAPS